MEMYEAPKVEVIEVEVEKGICSKWWNRRL